jgi:SAM-dependent methyltransferase
MSPPQQPRHPIRARFNAWLLDRMDVALESLYGARRRALFADLPHSVVEIGPGAGANFRYYRAGTHLIAIEPNPWLHARLRERAHRYGLVLDIHGLAGEQLDLPAASTDAVVCTLVLCSADQPARVVDEVKRVLRPGGRFLFVEHVAAPAGSSLRRFQRIVEPPWRWLFEGCCTTRETWRLLENAGFSGLELEHFRVKTSFIHVAPHIAGIAIR